jgi:hypothetical protein
MTHDADQHLRGGMDRLQFQPDLEDDVAARSRRRLGDA